MFGVLRASSFAASRPCVKCFGEMPDAQRTSINIFGVSPAPCQSSTSLALKNHGIRSDQRGTFAEMQPLTSSPCDPSSSPEALTPEIGFVPANPRAGNPTPKSIPKPQTSEV